MESFQHPKANRTGELVHYLMREIRDLEIREELKYFSLQISQRRVRYNIYGYFTMDFSLLYSVVGAVTTYLVIMIQFQFSYKRNPVSETGFTNNSDLFLKNYTHLNSTLLSHPLLNFKH